MEMTVLSKRLEDSQIKLLIRLIHAGKELITDYSGGMLAFVPKMRNTELREAIKEYRRPQAQAVLLRWATPDINGVLESLLSDHDAGELDFEDFASEFGYSDSRKAYKIWEACVEVKRKLRAFLGYEGIATLRRNIEEANS